MINTVCRCVSDAAIKLGWGGNNFCNICGNRAVFIRGFGICTELSKTNDLIAEGRRKHVMCPYCLSIDRFRWIWEILMGKGVLNKTDRVLHFAPEPCLSEKIRKYVSEYISGDIEPKKADEIIDITNINYPNHSFDVVIACHVLEHIPNEAKAVSELIRVIKPIEGRIILSFPIAKNLLNVVEDISPLSDKERIKKFGQADHVRIYGQDYKEHFEKYGLKVQTFIPKMMMTNKEIKEMALIPDDTVLVCRMV